MAPSTYSDSTTSQRAGLELTLVIALHSGVIAALLSFDVLPLPAPPATLLVRVVEPPPGHTEIMPPRPKTVSYKPAAQSRPEPVPQHPLLAAETQAPASAEAPAANPVAPTAPLPSTATAPPAARPAAVVSEPRFDAAYLDNPAPVYPALSRRIGEEGRVVLRVFVDASGRANQVEINTSSGSPRLDQSAQDTVARWKFFPAQRGAEAIGAWVLVPIVFNLRG